MTIEMPSASYIMTSWQKKQAAMLYHYSSLDYLRGLHGMVTDLINNDVDGFLKKANAQNRDEFLISKRWGHRNTSKNWENNAWPALRDLQVSLAKQIAHRPQGRYSFTAVNDRLRALNEYSLDWMTDNEEKIFQKSLAIISAYDNPIYDVLSEPNNRMTDFIFAAFYDDFSADRTSLPKFRVRLDVTASTGDPTPAIGVYIPLDDPHATLQFAWIQNDMKLRQANTFNKIGLDALNYVGRPDLWFDKEKMFEFADQPIYADKFREWIYTFGQPSKGSAPGAVGMHAFERRDCKWALVEMVPDQTELLPTLDEPAASKETPTERLRAGEMCSRDGFYLTPAIQHSRQFFKLGDIMPNATSQYGLTYWIWDVDQTA